MMVLERNSAPYPQKMKQNKQNKYLLEVDLMWVKPEFKNHKILTKN